MAAKKACLEKVPDAVFLKFDEIRRSNPNVQGYSDEAVGRQLNKSARQVCKMREIAKKKAELLKMKLKKNLLTQAKESILILLSWVCFLSCRNWKEERRNHRF